MYKLSANDKEINVKPGKDSGIGNIDGTDYQVDIKKVNDRSYHMIKDHKSYNIELVKVDFKSKEFHVKVNNTDYHFTAKDDFDLLLEELGMDNMNSQVINELKAPMPGLVLDVLVQPGDEVTEGDGLVVLEAMKMENVLKSPTNAVVKSIEITKSESVEKNQILINFEA